MKLGPQGGRGRKQCSRICTPLKRPRHLPNPRNRITPRKFPQRPLDILVHRHRLLTSPRLIPIRYRRHGFTLFHRAAGDTCIQRRPEHIHIPSICEVAVETVSRTIAVRPHEGLLVVLPLVLVAARVVFDFVEHVWEADGKVRRAHTASDVAGEVGDVGFTANRGGIFTVPTRWHEDLGAEVVGAFSSRKRVSVGSGLVAGTQVGYRFRGEVVGKGSCCGVAGEHVEAFWERLCSL